MTRLHIHSRAVTTMGRICSALTKRDHPVIRYPRELTMEVHTRSEDIGIQTFQTVQHAMEIADGDMSIWKISFDARNGERVRLVREGTKWVYESMADAMDEVALERISPEVKEILLSLDNNARVVLLGMHSASGQELYLMKLNLPIDMLTSFHQLKLLSDSGQLTELGNQVALAFRLISISALAKMKLTKSVREG